MSELPEPPDLEGTPILYTNLLRMVPSPLEFALDLGYIAPRDAQPDEPPKAQLRVVMSWEYAKFLRDAMQQVIEQREANAGEIKSPPGVVIATREME